MVILLINTILSYAIRVIICHACGSVYLMTAGLLRLFKTYFTFHIFYFILLFIYLMACSLNHSFTWLILFYYICVSICSL